MGCCGGGNNDNHNMDRGNQAHNSHAGNTNSRLIPALLIIAAVGALIYYYIR